MSLEETLDAVGERMQSLFDGLFISAGAPGLYARTETYERIVQALGALITAHRPSDAEALAFPPVMSRAHLERHGYLRNFPNLLGVVSCLCGDERQIRKTVDQFNAGLDWTPALEASDLVLSPAACFPVYPITAARGVAPEAGYTFDVSADCFRREPSSDIDRLQSFRMREFVRIGTRDQVLAFRGEWIDRSSSIAERLGLPHRIDQASDPFFGRGSQILAASQIGQSLKFELLVPIRPQAEPTACMSFNYHQDYFGQCWEINTADGAAAHTACVAFGIDRIGIALFAAHGLDIEAWPTSVREALGLQPS
jgi:seryl-tRNA synthetase